MDEIRAIVEKTRLKRGIRSKAEAYAVEDTNLDEVLNTEEDEVFFTNSQSLYKHPITKWIVDSGAFSYITN